MGESRIQKISSPSNSIQKTAYWCTHFAVVSKRFRVGFHMIPRRCATVQTNKKILYPNYVQSWQPQSQTKHPRVRFVCRGQRHPWGFVCIVHKTLFSARLCLICLFFFFFFFPKYLSAYIALFHFVACFCCYRNVLWFLFRFNNHIFTNMVLKHRTASQSAFRELPLLLRQLKVFYFTLLCLLFIWV